MSRPRVAIIGSKGIPARYGGYETFVEELAPRLVEGGWDVTVYCRRGKVGDVPSSGDGVEQETYRGVRLISTPYAPIRSLETLTHEATAFFHSLRRPPDLYYVLGTRAAPVAWIGKVTGRPIAMHTDGLEWARRKWGPAGRAFLRWSEWLAASGTATRLIADADAMRDYYRDRYGKAATVIHYGVDVVGPPDPTVLATFGLTPKGYDLVVCRLEPENNVDRIIAEHRAADLPEELVVVGGVAYEGDYQRGLESSAEEGRVRFLGPVYDEVDHLYTGARRYLHGHEVGGMNPSLLRAMGAGAPCFALDTPFNREALGDAGAYWTKARGDLAAQLSTIGVTALDGMGERAQERAADLFTWEACTDAHLEAFDALIRPS